VAGIKFCPYIVFFAEMLRKLAAVKDMILNAGRVLFIRIR